MSWSQNDLTLIGYSCLAYYNAAFIHGRAGNAQRAKEYLDQADLDGRELKQFTGNPVAAMWRVSQLEMARRYDGPDGAVAFMERLVQDPKKFAPADRPPLRQCAPAPRGHRGRHQGLRKRFQ